MEATTGPSVDVSSQTPLDDEVMSADPSTEIPRKFPLDDDDEAMSVDPPLDASRVFPDEPVLSLIKVLPKRLRNWRDDETVNGLDNILPKVFVSIAGFKEDNDGCPESFLRYEEQSLNNMKVVKKRDPAFLKSLREAIKGNNKELWIRVLAHGTPKMYRFINGSFPNF
jgi:hypothetical protein